MEFGRSIAIPLVSPPPRRQPTPHSHIPLRPTAAATVHADNVQPALLIPSRVHHRSGRHRTRIVVEASPHPRATTSVAYPVRRRMPDTPDPLVPLANSPIARQKADPRQSSKNRFPDVRCFPCVYPSGVLVYKQIPPPFCPFLCRLDTSPAHQVLS